MHPSAVLLRGVALTGTPSGSYRDLPGVLLLAERTHAIGHGDVRITCGTWRAAGARELGVPERQEPAWCVSEHLGAARRYVARSTFARKGIEFKDHALPTSLDSRARSPG